MLSDPMLRRHARLLDRFALLLCVGVVLGGVGVWAHPWLSPTASAAGIGAIPSQYLLGWPQWANVAIYALTATLQAYGLFRLHRAFAAAAHGEWFSLEVARGFQAFAWVLVALVPMGIVQQSVRGLLLTAIDPAQPTQLRIMIGPEHVVMLFAALLVLFMARIFVAGHELDTEARAIL